VSQAFFADIYAEAKRARPSPGHRALADVAAAGKLRRHYTLNIDGLAAAVGLSTWHPETNPAGAHAPPERVLAPACHEGRT
jgi:NAD-dependent SIR2 family protein deacetylase